MPFLLTLHLSYAGRAKQMFMARTYEKLDNGSQTSHAEDLLLLQTDKTSDRWTDSEHGARASRSQSYAAERPAARIDIVDNTR